MIGTKVHSGIPLLVYLIGLVGLFPPTPFEVATRESGG